MGHTGLSALHKLLFLLSQPLKNLKEFAGPVSIFVVVSLWIYVKWPGTFSPDSLDTWQQVVTGQYSDAHPTIYSWLISIFSFGGRSILSLQIVQHSFMVISLLLIISNLLSELSRNAKCYLVSGIYLLPFIGSMASTVWKDVLSTNLILIGIVLIWKQNNKLTLFSGMLFISVGSACRHEGYVILLLDAAIVLSITIINKLRSGSDPYGYKLPLILSLCAIVTFTNGKVAANILDAEVRPGLMFSGTFLGDLNYVRVSSPHLLAPKTRQFLEEISTGKSEEMSRNCTSMGWMVNYSGFDAAKAEMQSGKILDLWIHEFRKNPLAIYNARACRTQAFLPPLLSRGPSYVYWNHLEEFNEIQQGIIPRVDPRNLQLTYPPRNFVVTVMGYWELAWNKGLSFNIFQWPGLLVVLSGLLLALMRKIRVREFGLLQLLFVFSLARIAFLAVMAPAQDLRYGLITQIIFLAILLKGIHTFKKLWVQ